MAGLSIPGIIGVWMITGIILTFIFFGTAIIPGVNFIGVPLVLFGSTLIHVVFIVWILIVMIKQAEKFENYEKKNLNNKYHMI